MSKNIPERQKTNTIGPGSGDEERAKWHILAMCLYVSLLVLGEVLALRAVYAGGVGKLDLFAVCLAMGASVFYIACGTVLVLVNKGKEIYLYFLAGAGLIAIIFEVFVLFFDR